MENGLLHSDAERLLFSMRLKTEETSMNGNPHIGSDFDDFLAEEGMKEEITAAAMKRVIAWQLSEAMKRQGITQTEMAARMQTSRMVVRRLLDASDTSVTLATLARASVAVGVSFRLEMAPETA